MFPLGAHGRAGLTGRQCRSFFGIDMTAETVWCLIVSGACRFPGLRGIQHDLIRHDGLIVPVSGGRPSGSGNSSPSPRPKVFPLHQMPGNGQTP
jgi:hypothetical protein